MSHRLMSGAILDKLAERIFTVTWDGVGMFQIREECDSYFALDLTPDELAELSRELMRAAVTKGDD